VPKGLYKRLDEEEGKRLDEAADAIESGKTVELPDIFGNEIMPKMLEEKPLLLLSSLNKTDLELPANCLTYSKVLGEVCPGCDCTKNPELIKPYLEREMVLPILLAPLAEYKSAFADLVIQYPYIGSQTLDFLRMARLLSADEGKGALCPTCFDERCKEILKRVSIVSKDRKLADKLKTYLDDVVFPNLSPADYNEVKILEGIADAVTQNSLTKLQPLSDQAEVLFNLRNAEIFEATPEVNHDDLLNISQALRDTDYSQNFDFSKEILGKAWMVKALRIDYDPKMPIEDYLDIIGPRRKKVNSLISQLAAEKGKNAQLSEIRNEIQKINQEISSSKAVESITFATAFVHDNASILWGMLIGGLIGYSSASFAGCGVGSLAGVFGGIAEKIVSRKGAFSIPRYPKKTVEWLKEKIESPEERLLSILLAKDIKTIQVWNLRRRLRKA
jgi:hypothetical protein